MNKEEKSRAFIVLIIIGLLIAVVITTCVLVIVNKNNKDKVRVNFKQLYVSDGQIKYFGDDYFIVSEDNLNDAFIDASSSKKNRIDKPDYDNYYKTIDSKYILCKKLDDKTIVYSFYDGKVNHLYDIEYSDVDALLLKNDGKEYIVGFTLKKDDDIYFYTLDNDEPTVINNVSDLYVTNGDYYIIKTKDDKYGVLNTFFESVFNSIYSDIVITNDGKFILKNNKGKYGVFDEKGNVILTAKYDYITKQDNYYLLALNDKVALYDEAFNTIIDYSMNFNHQKNSLKLYNVDNKLVIVNNYHLDDSVVYKQNDLYVIINKKISESILINDSFYDDGVLLFTYGKSLVLFDDKESRKTIKVDDKVKSFRKINDNLLRIVFVNEDGNEYSKYYDMKLEVVHSPYEDLVYNSQDVYGFLDKTDKGDSFIITDYDFKELKRISGKSIDLYNDYLIVDNELYKIVVK